LLGGQYARPEFSYLSKNLWDFTEKINGTNIRVIFNGLGIRYAGKTDKAEMYPGMLKALHGLFDDNLSEFFNTFDGKLGLRTEVCFYGEGYGAKIQKGGGLYRPDQGFVLFDIKVNGVWLERHNLMNISETFNIDLVPIVGQGTLPQMVEMVRTGFNSQWGKFPAEGIVARPAVALKTRLGDRVITKLKTKDFKQEVLC
jgi:ATP-dependent RNA circularization protein (DNA/RNA ligase family)